MPRDMEQMRLLMALSLYIHSITMNPPTFIPATPEMLFGTETSEQQDNESEDYDYEYECEDEEIIEETELSSSTSGNTSSNWNMESRIVDLDDLGDSLERYV